MQKIELLAPAGNLEKLKYAYLYGADACYIGGTDFSLRANAKNFSIEDIQTACEYAHERNKKVYVTVNIIFHNEDYKNLEEYLQKLDKIGVDAIIIADLFIIDLVKKLNLKLKIHISTQNSTLNYKAVEFLSKYENVERIVLARECHKEEIKEIISKTKLGIECFLHGAMCSSYSGRCTLSNYFTNRDANRGGCAQICRWEFPLYDKDYKQISTDTLFTMSSKDLSMINSLKEMIDLGICSLKVEGRMRSNYYVATVINTYRCAIEDYYNHKLDTNKINYYKRILDSVANRESVCQFFDKMVDVDSQYYLGRNEVSNQDFLGIILDYDKKTNMVTLTQRNYFKKGDIAEIFGPNIETFSFKIPDIYDNDDNPLEVANHPEQIVKFKIDKQVYPNDIMRIKIN